MRCFQKFLFLFLLACLNVSFALGAPAGSAGVVTASGVPSLKPLHAGSLFTVAIEVTIKPGWHVNAHAGLPEGFIPAKLSLKADSPVSLASPPRYPSGEKMSMAGMPMPFSVYDGTVTLYADTRLTDTAKEGAARQASA